MLVSRTPVTRPTARPLAAVARPAAQAAPAAKPRAAAAASAPQKFEDLDAFKKFVDASPVMGLPAARERASKADAALAAANKTLESRQHALGQPGLASAVEAAKKGLESATYPYRGRAADLRAEATRTTQQIGEVSKRMIDLQQQIARAEGNKASRNRDYWRDDNYDGWDAVGDLLGSIGDSSTIKAAKAEIQKLIEKKVTLEQQVLTLTVEATALEGKLGDPAAIEQAKAKLKDAQDALANVEGQLAGEMRAVSAAKSELDSAQGKLKELESLKADLQNYSDHFGFMTRMKLMFSHFGWKKELDSYFKAKGL